MKTATRMILVASLLGLAAPATADVITDWNEKAVAAGYAANAGVANARNVAIVHLAMFEALN